MPRPTCSSTAWASGPWPTSPKPWPPDLAHTKPGAGGEIQLTDAMAEYARTRGGMTAVEFTGKHYDMGNKLKVVEAQVELALQHPEIGEEFRAYLKEFCKTL